jgi:hypothetical protein
MNTTALAILGFAVFYFGLRVTDALLGLIISLAGVGAMIYAVFF